MNTELEQHLAPTAVRCGTCKFFQTDVAYSNGKPCEFVGHCHHPSRDMRKEADDCCPDQEFANWAKAEQQEMYRK